MQTFLPYPSFQASAECLDTKRLGKQRVEAKQIITALTNPAYGWQHHPAVNMWRGHLGALKLYANAMIDEWVHRGWKNTMELYRVGVHEPRDMPAWLGDPAFHASHRSNLLRKDPAFYAQYDWDETPFLPYVWPTPAPDNLTDKEVLYAH